MPTDRRAQQQIREALAAGGAVALTGAGMSTASGIPDYRGPDGQRRVQPMQYADFLADPVNRQRYWARSYAGWEAFAAAQPNAGHLALARLEACGVVHAVITQNVDGLHQRAGSARVLDLHGSLAQVICLDCAAKEDRWQLQRRIASANPGLRATAVRIRPDGDVDLDPAQVAAFVAPRCAGCGSDRIKPDVVFFGGSVSRDLVERAYGWVDRADALLVLGSSLRVMSGLRFVRHAARRGIPVLAITRGSVRGPELIDVHLDALLGPELESLARSLS